MPWNLKKRHKNIPTYDEKLSPRAYLIKTVAQIVMLIIGQYLFYGRCTRRYFFVFLKKIKARNTSNYERNGPKVRLV